MMTTLKTLVMEVSKSCLFEPKSSIRLKYSTDLKNTLEEEVRFTYDHNLNI